MPRPHKPHDELDALLDGRPVELTEELVPLVEVADVLRAELATYELDPEAADRHLEQVLDGSATVVRIRPRQQPNGWDVRRRVAAVVLAAALVLAPATMASAAALPGQAMYPFKLAIEQMRLASVQWSPTREAGERTRIADTRVGELDRVVALEMFNQVGPALDAVTWAVQAARAAVDDAGKEGATLSEMNELAVRLGTVHRHALDVVTSVRSTLLRSPALDRLPADTRREIRDAVDDTQQVLQPPSETQPAQTQSSPPSTQVGPPATQTPPEQSTTPPSTAGSPAPTQPPTTQPPATTAAPTTTTTEPPTSTSPPSSAPEVTTGAAEPATPGGYSAGGQPPADRSEGPDPATQLSEP